jgi:hypothetical protein
MLFYLKNSLIVESTDPRYLDICMAVNEIGGGAYHSNHLLLGDIGAIEYFAKVFETDMRLKPLFNNLLQNIAMEVVPPSITEYVEVDLTDGQSYEANGKLIHRLGYTNFLNLNGNHSHLAERTILVAEDLNDCTVYRHILNWYINRVNPKLNIDFKEENGGGNNVSRVVERNLEDKQIVICIIDADARYPGYIPADDSTFKSCEVLKGLLYKFSPLLCHEIENIIPLNYIAAFKLWDEPNNKKNKKNFDYLLKGANDILPYFDYKNGIKQKDMQNPQFKKFASHCYVLNDELKKKQPDFDAYLQSLHKESPVYPQLLGGSGILTNTVALIKGNTCPPIPELLDFQEKIWNAIGQNMLNWCIARNEEALNC